ncbi:hypothetical protein LTR53_001585 [Teratosphaeriaceae sp. CCFEE 6253]|nr:hypothetical protein LTR53_001585 [Teratosphaeriaceae sp. CCFEE 6253]
MMPMAPRLHYIGQYIASANPTLALASVAIWMEAHMHLGLIACVSYCSKSFTAAFSTNYGSVAINLEVYDTTNHRTGYARSQGYGAGSGAGQSHGGNSSGPLSGRLGGTRTPVTGGSRRLSSKVSSESQRVIITDEIRMDQGPDVHEPAPVFCAARSFIMDRLRSMTWVGLRLGVSVEVPNAGLDFKAASTQSTGTRPTTRKHNPMVRSNWYCVTSKSVVKRSIIALASHMVICGC